MKPQFLTKRPSIIMSPTRNKPRWNIASLAAPVVGIVIVIPVYFAFGPVFGTLIGLNIYVSFSALGVLFAVISLVRFERWIFVSLVALVLNCLPWIWYAAHYPLQIGPHF
jgi:hypothetical protein